MYACPFVSPEAVNSVVAAVPTGAQLRLLVSLFSTWYLVISLPPLSAGGSHASVTESSVKLLMLSSCGGPGLSEEQRQQLELDDYFKQISMHSVGNQRRDNNQS